MKISALITNDKESVLLAFKLLGKPFLEFCKLKNLNSTCEMFQIIMNHPDRINITKDIIGAKYHYALATFSWLKNLIDEYEDFRVNVKR